MDGVTLLREAESAGLTVRADGDRLIVRGPKRAEPVALRLLAAKSVLLHALAVEKARQIQATVAELPAEWREQWRELVAIRVVQYGAMQEHAEADALADVLRMMAGCGEAT